MKSETAGDLRDKSFDIFPQVIFDNYLVDNALAGNDVYLFDHKEFKDLTGIVVQNLIDEELYKAHLLVKQLIEDGKFKHFTKVNAMELVHDTFFKWVEIGGLYITHKDNLNISNYLKEDTTGNKNITHCGNLCVAPETKILTREGYKVISDLQDEELDVWNGEEFSPVTVVKTGENQKLFKVVTTGGILVCTDYHKFYVEVNTNTGVEIVEKRTHQLEMGDKLIKFDLPVIEGSKTLELTYKENQDVPNITYDVKSRIKWLGELLDSVSTLVTGHGRSDILIHHTDYDYINDIMLMLQTLGVTATFNRLSLNDYVLQISEYNYRQLLSLGLVTTDNDIILKEHNDV